MARKKEHNKFEIVYSPKFGFQHDIHYPKPSFESYENPNRCYIPWKYLREQGYIPNEFNHNKKKGITNKKYQLALQKPPKLNRYDLKRVHTNNHIEKVKYFSKHGSGQIGYTVMATKDIWDISLTSSGAVYKALEDVFLGKSQRSFSFNRPPGHHAVSGEADGLCVFNNVALAIEKLRDVHNFNGNIAIIDIDAHFGDGISKIYYEDPSVLYCSMHEYGFGGAEEGHFTQIGVESGLGTNVNFPIPFEANDSFFRLFCDYVKPFVERFQPEMIMVPVGFDGHWMDPLGNLKFTSQGYRDFYKWILDLADKLCDGKIVLNLEGGYSHYAISHLMEDLICSFTGTKHPKAFDGFIQDIYSRKNHTKSLNSLFLVEYNQAKSMQKNNLLILDKLQRS